MPKCVSIKGLRDIAALDEKVKSSTEPITATKSGCGRFTCSRDSNSLRWESYDARAALLKRIMISDRERVQGLSSDAFESLSRLREKRGL